MTFLLVAFLLLALLVIGCFLADHDTPGTRLARFLDVLNPPVPDQEK